MPEPIKRPRYFDGQLLSQDDFTLEQTYELARRRLHNRALHTWGICEGLALSFIATAVRTTVSVGTALDAQGRDIVIAAPTDTPDVSSSAGKTLFVTAAYAEAETDGRTANGVTGNARYTEAPAIQVAEAAPANPGIQLILGRVTVGADGRITAVDDGVDSNRRRYAGALGGSLLVDTQHVNNGTLSPGLVFGSAQSGEGIASRRAPGANQYGLDFYTGSGKLRMSITNGGDVGIGTNTPAAKLSVAHDGGTEPRNYVLLVRQTTTTGEGTNSNALLRFEHTNGANSRNWLLGTGSQNRFGHPDNFGIADTVTGTALVVNNIGSVGIGTKEPGFPLDVGGRGRMRIRQGDNGTAGTWLYHTGIGDRAFVGMANNDQVGLWGNAGIGWGLTMRVDNGNVAIGTANPQAKLDVQGSAHLSGNLDWGEDHSSGGYVRLGSLQLCWGSGSMVAAQRENYQFVGFPVAFESAPTVTVSINDPGFGVEVPIGGVGAWDVQSAGFNVLYKVQQTSVHTESFHWIAIGRWR